MKGGDITNKNFDDFRALCSKDSDELAELSEEAATKIMKTLDVQNVNLNDVANVSAIVASAAVAASTENLFNILEKYHNWLTSKN